MRESCVLNLGGEICEAADRLLLFVDNVQPAQPLVFIFLGPERRIARPETIDSAIRLPIIDRSFNCLRQIRRQRNFQLIDIPTNDWPPAVYGA